jgi:hypothetical protein
VVRVWRRAVWAKDAGSTLVVQGRGEVDEITDFQLSHLGLSSINEV